jgi:hypothetical protein
VDSLSHCEALRHKQKGDNSEQTAVAELAVHKRHTQERFSPKLKRIQEEYVQETDVISVLPRLTSLFRKCFVTAIYG